MERRKDYDGSFVKLLTAAEKKKLIVYIYIRSYIPATFRSKRPCLNEKKNKIRRRGFFQTKSWK